MYQVISRTCWSLLIPHYSFTCVSLYTKACFLVVSLWEFVSCYSSVKAELNDGGWEKPRCYSLFSCFSNLIAKAASWMSVICMHWLKVKCLLANTGLRIKLQSMMTTRTKLDATHHSQSRQQQQALVFSNCFEDTVVWKMRGKYGGSKKALTLVYILKLQQYTTKKWFFFCYIIVNCEIVSMSSGLEECVALCWFLPWQ